MAIKKNKGETAASALCLLEPHSWMSGRPPTCRIPLFLSPSQDGRVGTHCARKLLTNLFLSEPAAPDMNVNVRSGKQDTHTHREFCVDTCLRGAPERGRRQGRLGQHGLSAVCSPWGYFLVFFLKIWFCKFSQIISEQTSSNPLKANSLSSRLVCLRWQRLLHWMSESGETKLTLRGKLKPVV
jgi:hypothetical protein